MYRPMTDPENGPHGWPHAETGNKRRRAHRAPANAIRTTQNIGKPAMKNWALHTVTTTMVIPTSGWAKRRALTSNKQPTAMMLPGNPSVVRCKANIQAATITRNGFTNSEGWTESAPSRNQRWAPLTSAPNINVPSIIRSPVAKPIAANLRIQMGDIKETASKIAIARGRNSDCLLDKVICIRADPFRSRRSGGKGQNHSNNHQGPGSNQEPPVDRPPPAADDTGIGTGERCAHA